MSNIGQEPTTEPTEETQAVTEGQAPEQETTTTAVSSVDDLPEWAQLEIKNLRSESAKRRREAKDTAKQAEELAAKQAEAQGKYQELYETEKQRRLEAEQAAEAARLAGIREKVARELNVPTSLVDRLKGETEEEIKSDAEAILADLPKPKPSGDTDSNRGANQQKSTPVMTEIELKEMAAIMNVNPEHLREYYRSQGMEISN